MSLHTKRLVGEQSGLVAARATIAAALAGSLLVGGNAGAYSEGHITLEGKQSGCSNLNVPKSITLDLPVLKAETEGRYALITLYPADSRYQPSNQNTYGEIYTRDTVNSLQFADQTTFNRGNYKICLLTDGASTISLAVMGLKGTLKPKLKPDRRLQPDFYSRVLTGPTATVEAIQGVRRDMTITDKSWQVANKELIITDGPGASLGERPVCIRAKDTDEAFCNRPPNPYNIRPGQGSSQVFNTPVSVAPGEATPGSYEVSYTGVEVKSRVVVTAFQFTPVQN